MQLAASLKLPSSQSWTPKSQIEHSFVTLKFYTIFVKSAGMSNIWDFTIADAICSQSQITIIMKLDTQIPD
jgi:hypothetical protein